MPDFLKQQFGIVEAKANGLSGADMLLQYGDRLIAVRTLLEQMQIQVERGHDSYIRGQLVLRITDLKTVPDEWKEKMKQKALPPHYAAIEDKTG